MTRAAIAFDLMEDGACTCWGFIELDAGEKVGKLIGGGMTKATVKSVKLRSSEMTGSDKIPEQNWVISGADDRNMATKGSLDESIFDIVEVNINFVQVIHAHYHWNDYIDHMHLKSEPYVTHWKIDGGHAK